MKGYTIQHSIDLLEKKVEAGGSGGSTTAESVSYDNTSSGLTADDVQEAIDELHTAIGNIDTLVHYSTTETKIGTFDGLDYYAKILKLPAAVELPISGAWTASGVSVPEGGTYISLTLVALYGGGSIGVYVNAGTGAISFANIQKVGAITLAADTPVLVTYTKAAPVSNTRKKSSK